MVFAFVAVICCDRVWGPVQWAEKQWLDLQLDWSELSLDQDGLKVFPYEDASPSTAFVGAGWSLVHARLSIGLL